MRKFKFIALLSIPLAFVVGSEYWLVMPSDNSLLGAAKNSIFELIFSSQQPRLFYPGMALALGALYCFQIYLLIRVRRSNLLPVDLFGERLLNFTVIVLFSVLLLFQ